MRGFANAYPGFLLQFFSDYPDLLLWILALLGVLSDSAVYPADAFRFFAFLLYSDFTVSDLFTPLADQPLHRRLPPARHAGVQGSAARVFGLPGSMGNLMLPVRREVPRPLQELARVHRWLFLAISYNMLQPGYNVALVTGVSTRHSFYQPLLPDPRRRPPEGAPSPPYACLASPTSRSP
mmetsp:Transcript_69682/g.215441  ORF Transcript_69682/g.215441 Transcript_69682/m.215441 type:complete len:180 (+) Transcript_69682:720-1259(+)